MATIRGLILITLMLLLRRMLRSTRASLAAFLAVVAVAYILSFDGRGPAAWLVAVTVSAVSALGLRFAGLLPIVVCHFTALLLRCHPITVNWQAWYGRSAEVALLMISGLIGLGLYSCLTAHPADKARGSAWARA